jgi:N-sulfoglucosamine sulfohydrolase
MRTLRGRKYKLIWNLTPGTEYPLPIDTVQRRTWAELRGRGDEKIGSRLVEDFLHRPRLELYDLETDPWETKNLADDPELAKIREEMVARLMGHLEKQKDPWIRKYHPMEKEQ